MVGEMRFELIKPIGNAINKWWVELESNQPSHKASDLQSDPLPATEYRPILTRHKKNILIAKIQLLLR